MIDYEPIAREKAKAFLSTRRYYCKEYYDRALTELTILLDESMCDAHEQALKGGGGKFEFWQKRLTPYSPTTMSLKHRPRWFWHYKSPGNHEIIYQGKTTGYRSKRACMRAIELAKDSKGAEIREVG